ncbi:MAG: recombination protein RecR [Mycoplasmataceae bacterium]|nr:recombination protein RecR [Mycoplasmataceae bacterium]
MKPNSLIELTNELSSLPGISKKNAEKIAYHIANSENEVGNELIETIKNVNDKISKCDKCNHISESKECGICSDKTRTKILVVVETPLDIFKFEEMLDFKPYYHVLGGLINVSKRISFDELNTDKLKERAEKMNEVILALSPNLEGIVTSNYIKEILYGIKVTQLAQGIPLGAAMEYVDEITLKAALENRKEVK